MTSGNMTDLENTIGYSFQNPELLLRATTHRSYGRESSVFAGEPPNEQMEFLGDAVLGFLVSEALVEQFPDYSEGPLSKCKAHLVSASYLHQVAQQIALGQFLRLGKGEEQSGGRTKRTLLADALEALVAAIYLDGGLEPTRRFVRHWVLGSLDWQQIQVADYKSELQEFLQGQGAPQPRYLVIRERGPEHHKVFTVRVQVGTKRLAQAEGDNKKAAQQAAAQIALAQLRRDAVGTGNHQTD
ncbi:MAG: ribonuclease III [Acidobacteria bacterium]|nr:ribonuclease III [Acidobacteriota bacterium]